MRAGYAVDAVRDGAEAHVDGNRTSLRRHRVGRHLGRRRRAVRRVRRLQGAEGGGLLDAGADGHRPRRRRGSGARPRCGGRRLPAQTVLVRRAACQSAGAHPARRPGATGGAELRRPAPRSRRPTRSDGANPSSSSRPRSSLCSNVSCATGDGPSAAPSWSSTSGISRTRVILASSTCSCGRSVTRSTAPSVSARSRRCEGVGYRMSDADIA